MTSSKPRPSDKLKTAQFAELAGVSRSTVVRWIAEGFIPSEAVTRIRKQFRVARWALDEIEIAR